MDKVREEEIAKVRVEIQIEYKSEIDNGQTVRLLTLA